MSNTNIPYYYKSIDWENFVKLYAPPAEFEKTVYKWGRDKLRKHQDEKFKKILMVAWNNPFYKRKWTEAGLKPNDIKGLNDIHKLPFVTVHEFLDEIKKNPPFGLHQGITIQGAKEKPLKIQSSGGTTGKPRPTLFGPVEWELNGMTAARAFYIQGARPADIMQIPLTNSTANAGWCWYYGCHAWLGVVAITSGSGVVTPTRRQLELATEWGTNLWASFPEYMGHIAKVAREEMNFDVRDLKTKFIHSYLGPDISGKLRKELENIWGCDVYDNYGTHETGVACFECREKAGLHFHEDLCYVEAVDSETNELVNIAAGEKGDLVFTSLYREHPPLIRFNFKDLVRFIDYGKKCACGSYLLRMDHFLGRSDDMVKLRGTNLYPMACLDSIKADDRATGEWICIMERIGEGLSATEEMTVKIEYKDAEIDKDDFKTKMEQRLKTDLGVRVTVEPVPAGCLAPLTRVGGEGKPKRLLDKRPKER